MKVIRIFASVLTYSLTCITLFSPFVVAEGENHGPHAGYIREGIKDPASKGAVVPLNTELLVQKEGEITVYLIDKTWNNVELQDSVVTVSYVPVKGKKAPLACKDMKWNGLTCQLPKGAKWTAGDKIVINHSKKGDATLIFEYLYPFQHLG